MQRWKTTDSETIPDCCVSKVFPCRISPRIQDLMALRDSLEFWSLFFPAMRNCIQIWHTTWCVLHTIAVYRYLQYLFILIRIRASCVSLRYLFASGETGGTSWPDSGRLRWMMIMLSRNDILEIAKTGHRQICFLRFTESVRPWWFLSAFKLYDAPCSLLLSHARKSGRQSSHLISQLSISVFTLYLSLSNYLPLSPVVLRTLRYIILFDIPPHTVIIKQKKTNKTKKRVRAPPGITLAWPMCPHTLDVNSDPFCESKDGNDGCSLCYINKLTHTYRHTYTQTDKQTNEHTTC